MTTEDNKVKLARELQRITKLDIEQPRPGHSTPDAASQEQSFSSRVLVGFPL